MKNIKSCWSFKWVQMTKVATCVRKFCVIIRRLTRDLKRRTRMIWLVFNNQLVDDAGFSECICNSRDNYDIEIVGPSLKNKINFDKGKNLQFFMNKYAKPYDANKKHSVANFLKWVNAKNIINMVENIPKKNLDDIADSVNMALAWIFIKSGWLD